MRIAYLILVHNTPRHVERLIKALSGNDQEFIVHVDAKVDLASFSHLLRLSDGAVRFTTRRVPVYWGEYSQLEAILTVIAEALSGVVAPNYLVLLSGSDYPLESPGYIAHYLEQREGAQFINLVRMPSAELGKPISRLERFCPRSDRLGGRALKPLAMFAYESLKWRRNHAAALGVLVPYAGSASWALTADAGRYVLDFSRQRRREMRFFANTAHPDEHVIHTVIANSTFADRIERDVHYADWSHAGPSPATLSEVHIHQLTKQAHVLADDGYGRGALLFARKFPDASEALTGLIDKWIADKQREQRHDPP
jgi:Core-2/I-Branching enzyme